MMILEGGSALAKKCIFAISLTLDIVPTWTHTHTHLYIFMYTLYTDIELATCLGSTSLLAALQKA